MKRQNIIRRNSLFHFGFGIKTMKKTVVCSYCNSLEQKNKTYCSKCSAKLPKTNLYDLYKSYHLCCEKCDTVLSPYMHFCPHCGIKVMASNELYAMQKI